MWKPAESAASCCCFQADRAACGGGAGSAVRGVSPLLLLPFRPAFSLPAGALAGERRLLPKGDLAVALHWNRGEGMQQGAK